MGVVTLWRCLALKAERGVNWPRQGVKWVQSIVYEPSVRRIRNGGHTMAEPDENTLIPQVRAIRVGGKCCGGGHGVGHLYTFKVKSQFKSDNSINSAGIL